MDAGRLLPLLGEWLNWLSMELVSETRVSSDSQREEHHGHCSMPPPVVCNGGIHFTLFPR